MSKKSDFQVKRAKAQKQMRVKERQGRKVLARRSKRAPPLAADQKTAGDLRAKMVAALLPVCALLDEAAAAGMAVGFHVAPGAPDNLNHVKHVTIHRQL